MPHLNENQVDRSAPLMVRKTHLGTLRFYDYFNVPQRGFTVILLGKDGEEKHHQSNALSMDKLFNMIDAMPMPKAEMRQGK